MAKGGEMGGEVVPVAAGRGGPKGLTGAPSRWRRSWCCCCWMAAAAAAAEALATAVAQAACGKLKGGERAVGGWAARAASEVITGEEADDREVTLLPEGEGGCARIGEGLLEVAGRGLMSASLPPLLPRMWSMPKLSLPVVTVAGEDIVRSLR